MPAATTAAPLRTALTSWRAVHWAGRHRRGALLRAALGTTVAIALTVAALSLADASRASLHALVGDLVDRVRIVAGRANTLGPAAGAPLTATALAKLTRLPGVVAVYPEAWAQVPTVLRTDAFGKPVVSEGALLGIDPRAVDAPAAFRFVPGEPIPVLVPRSVLAVYNGSFARLHALPRLDERLLRGQHFTIVVGASTLRGTTMAGQRTVAARIVGVAAYGDALAALVPLDAIDWLHAQSLPNTAHGQRSAAQVVLGLQHDADRFAGTLAAEGLRAEPADGQLAQVARLLRAAERSVLIVGAIASLATTLVAIQVYGLTLRLRGSELQTLLALGVTPKVLRAAVTAEYVGAVLVACALGVLAGQALAIVAAPFIETLLIDTAGIELLVDAMPSGRTITGALLLAPLLTALALQWPLGAVMRDGARDSAMAGDS